MLAHVVCPDNAFFHVRRFLFVLSWSLFARIGLNKDGADEREGRTHPVSVDLKCRSTSRVSICSGAASANALLD